jgi:hypothetical protein
VPTTPDATREMKPPSNCANRQRQKAADPVLSNAKEAVVGLRVLDAAHAISKVIIDL